jgi:GNAT superfamily N-acetyltransferase
VLGLGLAWEVGGGKGAAVWVPPDLSEAWKENPWNQPRISALTDDGGHRYDAFWDWVDSRIPDERLWQLDSIAVAASAQGRGFGAALIGVGLEQARADGVGAFLSTGTPRNVSIYGRCGFHVVQDVDAPGGGPHIWFMRWDP